MRFRIGCIAGLAAVSAGLLSVGCGALRAVEPPAKEQVRVGVYDSRCVAIAYTHSRFHDNEMQKLFDIVHKAEAEGDTDAAQKARQTAEYMQKKRHLQGFGTAPVQDLLEPVKDKLPDVAAAVGVDVIVSKWALDYRSSDAAVTDVTDAVVALYEPNERALKWIRQIKDIPPVSEQEILENDH